MLDIKAIEEVTSTNREKIKATLAKFEAERIAIEKQAAELEARASKLRRDSLGAKPELDDIKERLTEQRSQCFEAMRDAIVTWVNSDKDQYFFTAVSQALTNFHRARSLNEALALKNGPAAVALIAIGKLENVKSAPLVSGGSSMPYQVSKLSHMKPFELIKLCEALGICSDEIIKAIECKDLLSDVRASYLPRNITALPDDNGHFIPYLSKGDFVHVFGNESAYDAYKSGLEHPDTKERFAAFKNAMDYKMSRTADNSFGA